MTTPFTYLVEWYEKQIWAVHGIVQVPKSKTHSDLKSAESFVNWLKSGGIDWIRLSRCQVLLQIEPPEPVPPPERLADAVKRRKNERAERNQEIVGLFETGDYTYEALAKRYSISKQRVNQIIQKFKEVK